MNEEIIQELYENGIEERIIKEQEPQEREIPEYFNEEFYNLLLEEKKSYKEILEKNEYDCSKDKTTNQVGYSNKKVNKEVCGWLVQNIYGFLEEEQNLKNNEENKDFFITKKEIANTLCVLVNNLSDKHLVDSEKFKIENINRMLNNNYFDKHIPETIKQIRVEDINHPIKEYIKRTHEKDDLVYTKTDLKKY